MVEDVWWRARGVAGIKIKCAVSGQLEFRSAGPLAGQPGVLRHISRLEIQLTFKLPVKGGGAPVPKWLRGSPRQ